MDTGEETFTASYLFPDEPEPEIFSLTRPRACFLSLSEQDYFLMLVRVAQYAWN